MTSSRTNQTIPGLHIWPDRFLDQNILPLSNQQSQLIYPTAKCSLETVYFSNSGTEYLGGVSRFLDSRASNAVEGISLLS